MINGLNILSTLARRKVNSEASAGRCVTCLSTPAQHGICVDCRNDLPANRYACRVCALPLPFSLPDQRCGECLSDPPPYTRSLIPWRYQFPVDGMIGRYKYHGQHRFARPLLAGFSDYLENNLAQNEWPEALIPAPMHWARRWHRGFNQAQDIAEAVSRRLGRPEVFSSAIRRTRRVQAQRQLDRAGRLANLRGLFEVTAPIPARVAIVDDVVTTGATARAIASVLAEAGAEDIQIWALARTPG
ncbi:ComF family protein [Marinobacter daepoensis]|uniref:ComF family protein n=1 Tax=Marinobacter daepoensis TaxID=262077 RepID=A0ABS3BH58_9GAMM|nr:ComF family protein [Marinobacter daepoensis]MBN7771154.1 ComF family protein [Marinobacter daepoensis]MBY6079016.1 ComF family protein [Marinobacter daepoensis]